jgi:DNA-3-methyladenine glycosylase
MNIVPLSFFENADVLEISRSLLGKTLLTRIEGKLCGGIITETEAYKGIEDRASHAYGGKRTQRTEVMYANGGTIYVYLCYGIHNLFNIVTNKQEIPHAVLIRAIKPTHGIETILHRRKSSKLTKDICMGPGKVTQALGISREHNDKPLRNGFIWIEKSSDKISSNQIIITPRIGVDYAGEDAKLPYRFVLKN